MADKEIVINADITGSDWMKKADKTDLDNLTNVVENKANKTDLDNLTNVVENKANKTDLDNLTTVVGNKADKTDVDKKQNKLNPAGNIEITPQPDGTDNIRSFDASFDNNKFLKDYSLYSKDDAYNTSDLIMGTLGYMDKYYKQKDSWNLVGTFQNTLTQEGKIVIQYLQVASGVIKPNTVYRFEVCNSQGHTSGTGTGYGDVLGSYYLYLKTADDVEKTASMSLLLWNGFGAEPTTNLTYAMVDISGIQFQITTYTSTSTMDGMPILLGLRVYEEK